MKRQVIIASATAPSYLEGDLQGKLDKLDDDMEVKSIEFKMIDEGPSTTRYSALVYVEQKH